LHERIQQRLTQDLGAIDATQEGQPDFDVIWQAETRLRRQCQLIACALLDDAGRFSSAAIKPITALLVEDDRCELLPWALHQRWFTLSLQLQDPALELGPCLDQLSAIEHVHPHAQALLAVACGSAAPRRPQRAAACLMALLQP